MLKILLLPLQIGLFYAILLHIGSAIVCGLVLPPTFNYWMVFFELELIIGFWLAFGIGIIPFVGPALTYGIVVSGLLTLAVWIFARDATISNIIDPLAEVCRVVIQWILGIPDWFSRLAEDFS